MSFTPILLVDGDRVLASSDELSAVKVDGQGGRSAKGPKIIGFTYKNKSRSRRRWGHRQHYSTIEIISINAPAKKRTRGANDVQDQGWRLHPQRP